MEIGPASFLSPLRTGLYLWKGSLKEAVGLQALTMHIHSWSQVWDLKVSVLHMVDRA